MPWRRELGAVELAVHLLPLKNASVVGEVLGEPAAGRAQSLLASKCPRQRRAAF